MAFAASTSKLLAGYERVMPLPLMPPSRPESRLCMPNSVSYSIDSGWFGGRWWTTEAVNARENRETPGVVR